MFLSDNIDNDLPSKCTNQYRIGVWCSRKEVFFENFRAIWLKNISLFPHKTIDCLKTMTSKIHYLFQMIVDIYRQYLRKISPLPLELSFETIIRCLNDKHLLSRILLLFSKSNGRVYFPWDVVSPLSLSIFLFSPHCARFTVHVFAQSVPCTGHSPCEGQPQSISSTSKTPHTCRNETLSHENTMSTDKTDSAVICSDAQNTPRDMDLCTQLHACDCITNHNTPISFGGGFWLHNQLHRPYIPKRRKYYCSTSFYLHLRSLFLLSLMFSSLFPNAGAQFTTSGEPTNNRTHTNLSSEQGPMFKLFCDQFEWEQLLTSAQMRECNATNCDNNDKSACCDIQRKDEAAENAVKFFEKTMSKYATPERYSVRWHLECCKTAYKNWMCSQSHQYYEISSDGERVEKPPCPSICARVERSCPFFRVHYTTKLYGGQPTFLCQGFQTKDPDLSCNCYNMKDWTCEPRHRHNLHQSDTEYWSLTESPTRCNPDKHLTQNSTSTTPLLDTTTVLSTQTVEQNTTITSHATTCGPSFSVFSFLLSHWFANRWS